MEATQPCPAARRGDDQLGRVDGAGNAEAALGLPPGFRFHPTDEELVTHYLCRKAARLPPPVPIIADVDLYRFDPWDLPERALFGRREWYFFSPRGRKYPNGNRPNRAAGSGFWKATGADKPVAGVGVKKALVFYSGRAPRGVKTDWIMHEYLLADTGGHRSNAGHNAKLDEWVLCRLYNKKIKWGKEPKSNQAEGPADEAVSADTPPGSVDETHGGEDVNNCAPSYADMAAAHELEVPANEDSIGWLTGLNLDDIPASCNMGLGPPAAGYGLESYCLPPLASPSPRINLWMW